VILICYFVEEQESDIILIIQQKIWLFNGINLKIEGHYHKLYILETNRITTRKLMETI